MSLHDIEDLRQRQSLPLQAKILMTQSRIREWVDYWHDDVYVSFSGGKDSTVLKHIVDQMYDNIPAVFVNTGLEYPEIQTFVREIKAGKHECFNPDVEIIRPEMRFDEVVKRYGYPIISKQVADTVEGARRNPTGSRMLRLNGEYGGRKDGKPSKFDMPQWKFLLDADFLISAKCCDIMKKHPLKGYEKATGRVPMIGILAGESEVRKREWLHKGCNAFDTARPQSRPLSFWTEQDILLYLKKYDVPYCSVYGDIKRKTDGNAIDGQMEIYDYLEGYEAEGTLENTGCDRTGCMFCMFGCHLEKEPNRFQRMKITHPKQYEYCMNQLGLKEVLEYIGVPYE